MKIYRKIILVFIILLINVLLVQGDVTPDICGTSNCNAGDLYITSIQLQSSGECTPSSTQTLNLYATFVVTNNKARNCPFAVINYLDGTTVRQSKKWVTGLAGSASGTYYNVLIGSITYTCGNKIQINEIYAQWAATNIPDTGCPTTCTNYYPPPKCYYNNKPIIFPDFSYNSACLHNSISFTAIGTYSSYQWSFGDGHTASGSNVVYTYENPGKYTVTLTVTDANGFVISNSHNVYVYNLPNADFTYTQECGTNVLFEDTSTVTPTADVTPTINGWSWDINNDGSVESNLQDFEYIFGVPGKYPVGTYPVKLTVTDSKGCTDTEIKTITVQPGATATAISNSPVCEDQEIQLYGWLNDCSLPACNPLHLSYSWVYPDTTVHSGQSQTINHYPDPLTDADAGTYTLTITDDITECEFQAMTNVLVYEYPKIEIKVYPI